MAYGNFNWVFHTFKPSANTPGTPKYKESLQTIKLPYMIILKITPSICGNFIVHKDALYFGVPSVIHAQSQYIRSIIFSNTINHVIHSFSQSSMLLDISEDNSQYQIQIEFHILEYKIKIIFCLIE
jgi:hypothetical protein